MRLGIQVLLSGMAFMAVSTSIAFADVTIRVVERPWLQMTSAAKSVSKGKITFLIQSDFSKQDLASIIADAAFPKKADISIFSIKDNSSKAKLQSYTWQQLTYDGDNLSKSQLLDQIKASFRIGNELIAKNTDNGEIIQTSPLFTIVKPRPGQHCPDNVANIHMIFYIDKHTPVAADKINLIDPKLTLSEHYKDCSNPKAALLSVFDNRVTRTPIVQLVVDPASRALFEKFKIRTDPIASAYMKRSYFLTSFERDLSYRHFEISAQAALMGLARQSQIDIVSVSKEIVQNAEARFHLSGLAHEKEEIQRERARLRDEEKKYTELDRLVSMFHDLETQFVKRARKCLGSELKDGFDSPRPGYTLYYENMYAKFRSVDRVRDYYRSNDIGRECD